MLVYIYTEDRQTVKDKMEDGGRLTPRKRDWHVQVARAETEIGDVLSRPFPAGGGGRMTTRVKIKALLSL